jgi:hypothetical protein
VIARAASHTRRMARRDEMSMSSDDAAAGYAGRTGAGRFGPQRACAHPCALRNAIRGVAEVGPEFLR